MHSATCCTNDSEDTSPTSAAACAPALRSRSTWFSSGCTSNRITRQLRRASSAAVARPTPCAAPVTTMVFTRTSPSWRVAWRGIDRLPGIDRLLDLDPQPGDGARGGEGRAENERRMPQMLARQIADDGDAYDASEIAPRVHDAAHRHGVPTPHRHGRSPVSAFAEFYGGKANRESRHREIGIRGIHRNQQQGAGGGD